MPRKYIRDLGQQDVVDEVFVASGKQLRPNRNGNLYLQVELSDRTGSISTRLWNADDALYQSFNDGDYVRVRNTQLFQGAVQMIAKRIERVEPEEVDPAEFEPEAAVDVNRLLARMKELIRSMGDLHLRTLAECFLLDEEFLTRFTLAPAGTKHHHSYHGGLLEHTVGVMEAADRMRRIIRGSIAIFSCSAPCCTTSARRASWDSRAVWSIPTKANSWGMSLSLSRCSTRRWRRPSGWAASRFRKKPS